MTRLPLLATLGLVAASLAVPAAGHAAVLSAACTVTVNYSLNGTLLQTYARDFTLQEGVPFLEDLSTPTRQKAFAAELVRNGNRSDVAMNYFNDVDTFDAIMIDTSLALVRRGATESSTGRHTFSTSQGVAGNHLTAWSFSCRAN